MASAMAAARHTGIGTGMALHRTSATSFTRLGRAGVVVCRTRWTRRASHLSRLRPFSFATTAHPTHQRLDACCTSLSCISNSQMLTSSKQILRYLAPRPPKGEESNAVALVIRAGLVDIIKGFLTLIWNTFIKGPALVVAKLFQRDVDQATDIVKEGAEVVLKIAQTVNSVADAVEAYAEQVEEIAEKVVNTTDKIDEELEDVVEVLTNADDFDELAEGISRETGISIDNLANLKDKSTTVQAKSAELKSASSDLKEATKTALQDSKPDS